MALIASGIQKSFAGTSVLKDASLSIGDGSFLTIVGPNGSGKTTLLRILAGIETPDCGTVECVGDIDVVRRPVHWMMTPYTLDPQRTVRHNLSVPLRQRDLSWFQKLPAIGAPFATELLAEISDSAQRTAVALNIEELLDRMPDQLSGGQAQRVAIGQAVTLNATAFLFDEPYAGLDATSRALLRAELFELHRMLGATFIYATGDPEEAMKMPDTIAVMLDGRVVQIGPPDAVYDDPDSLEVARFIGSPKINLLPGELSADGYLSLFGQVLARYRVSFAKPVTVGIRPEAIVLGAPSEASLAGVRIDCDSGTAGYLSFDVAGHRLCVVAPSHPIGDKVSLHVNPPSILLFDADGARLRLPMLQMAKPDTHRARAVSHDYSFR
ncbi:MAG: ABC transporter ATP-binding protein [Pseudomonadota bacterium]